MKFDLIQNKQYDKSYISNQESTITQYEKLQSLYQTNLEFLFNLVIEVISRISKYQKQELQENKQTIKVDRREIPMMEDHSEVIEKSLISTSSLEYQFECFDKQLHTLQTIINEQKNEIEVAFKYYL